jgi:photosystem II stability/assembly factor-like uncharacterized protein
MRLFTLIILCLVLSELSYGQTTTSASSASQNSTSATRNIYEIKKQFQYQELHNPAEKEENGDDNELARFNRWYHDVKVRCYPTGELPSPDVLLKAHNAQLAASKNQRKTTTAPVWQPVGPMTVPINNDGIGRINCIVIDPLDTNKLYIGAACGGVFISHDGGNTWTSNTDHFPSLSIADIAVNPHHTDTIYAATGDGYGYEGGLYSIFWGGLYSAGVMKSSDGGNTWNTTGLSYLQSDNDIIQKLLIHPDKTALLLAATRNGMKRTTDAGATWTTVDTGHIYSMAFKPGSPDTVYAINKHDLRVSYNAGATWQTLYAGINVNSNRCTIAVSPAAPNAVWVLNSRNSLKWSHDGGQSFDTTISPSDTAHFYGYYDRVLGVSPDDSNYVVACGMIMAKSSDACHSWFKLDNDYYVHPDNHAITFNPLNPSTIYTGNDGGISVTHDGGSTWTNLSNGLMISQIYRLSTSRQDPNIMLCGLQDNGTIRYDGTTWKWVTGGDGEACAINPQNDYYQVSSYQYGNFYFSIDQGMNFSNTSISAQNADWTAPVLYDPNNSNTIYFGYEDVWVTHDGGSSFSNYTNVATFPDGCTAMAIAPSNSNVFYAADLGHIIRTTDGGSTWTNVTGNLPVNLVGITRVTVDPRNAMKVYVTTSGYTAGMKVFTSTAGGNTWTNISGTLPNMPANCIAADTSTPGALFVGTDMGVYYTDSSQSGWTLYGTGLPNVIVNDLDINYNDYKLRVATYGRGVWKTKLKKDPSTSIVNIAAQPALKLLASPNPTKDSWTLSFQGKKPANYTVKVLDITGRVIYTRQNSEFVDATGLASGVYNIEVIADNARYHVKAVKE